MTEEQAKKLAIITLMNTRILAKLTDALYGLCEEILPLISDNENALKKLHMIEQLQGATNELSSGLSETAREIGVELPGSGDANDSPS